MTVLVADAHEHTESLVSVVKMATAPDVYYRRATFYCAFYGQRDSMQRILINKCFPFAVGSVRRVKSFTSELRNSLKDFRKSRMMPEQVRSG
jgi:hypothetical protein